MMEPPCADTKSAEWESGRAAEIEMLRSRLRSLEDGAEGGAEKWAIVRQGREREVGELEARLGEKQDEERRMWKANEAKRRAQEVIGLFPASNFEHRPVRFVSFCSIREGRKKGWQHAQRRHLGQDPLAGGAPS